MADFSFTIPAADVNTLKNTSGSTDFKAVADRGLSKTTKHRILTAQFGDGYSQRVRDGINTKIESFSISFNNRSAEEINLIAAYFDSKAGLHFVLNITDTFTSGALSESAIKVVCKEYSTQYTNTLNHSLKTTFTRVYEP